jgi:hypothetical protein
VGERLLSFISGCSDFDIFEKVNDVCQKGAFNSFKVRDYCFFQNDDQQVKNFMLLDWIYLAAGL